MASLSAPHSSDDDGDAPAGADNMTTAGPSRSAAPPPLPAPLPAPPIPLARPVGDAPRSPNVDELREWLGVAPADIPCWFSMFALGGMFLTTHDAIDVVLAVLAALLAGVAWIIALRTKPNVSAFTNVVRMISYPAYVLFVLAVIVFHYWIWEA